MISFTTLSLEKKRLIEIENVFWCSEVSLLINERHISCSAIVFVFVSIDDKARRYFCEHFVGLISGVRGARLVLVRFFVIRSYLF